jgi:hypothetical protein
MSPAASDHASHSGIAGYRRQPYTYSYATPQILNRHFPQDQAFAQ